MVGITLQMTKRSISPYKFFIEFLQQRTFGIYLKKFSGETKEWAGEGVVVVEGIPLQFTGLYFTQHPPLLNSPHNTPVIEEGNKYKKRISTNSTSPEQEGRK